MRQVSKLFEEHCKNSWDHDQGKHRMCFSDEHYMSTMFAWKGLDNETDCKVLAPVPACLRLPSVTDRLKCIVLTTTAVLSMLAAHVRALRICLPIDS